LNKSEYQQVGIVKKLKLNVEYGVIIGIMEDKTNCKKEIERVGGGNQEEYFQSESNKIDGFFSLNQIKLTD